MNSYERKRRICKVIVLVLGILSINNIILTIRNYSYAYFEKNVKTGVKLKITTLDKMPSKDLKDSILSDANKKNCSDNKKPIIEDDDGTIYFSGDNNCIDFNYVWYSGKLWRVVAINPDGTMKMVTQDIMTIIYWGADAKNYKGSWIYQWLNEDFKDTLYNYEEIIVQNASWNTTEDGNDTPVRPPTDSTATKVSGDVGLLNAYEYYQSYKNAGYSNGYLNIKNDFFLITPYSNSYIRFASNYGYLSYNSTSSGYGIRPSINLNSNIEKVIGGNGKRYNPYRINGDKKTGNTGELINTRLSGEYVKVDNKVYRIVGIENNKTKLTSVDYAKSGNQNLSKSFGSNTRWGTSVSSGSDDYWGYYLNNTWITTELQKYITTGTYYLGQVSVSSSYKNSICSNSNTTEPIISCTKTTSTWTGKVGLPRVGEMFSAQLGKGRSNGASYMWLITPYSSSTVVKITDYGSFNSNITSGQFVVRPSIYLKPEVIITGGDGMSETTAYTIGLES